jgi:hypothetical protein
VGFDAGGELFYSLWDEGVICRDNGDGTSTVVVDGLSQPAAFDFLPAGDIGVADHGTDRILRAPFAGPGWGAAQAVSVPGFTIADPTAVRVAPSGLLYVCNAGGHEILEVDVTAGTARRVAGTGVAGFSGDNGPAVIAQLAYPTDIDLNVVGAMVIADGHNNRIRAVNLNASGAIQLVGRSIDAGHIVTIAGSGPKSTTGGLFSNAVGSHSGDDRHGRAAHMDWPFAPRIEGDRVWYVDADNHRVRVIDEFGYSHTVVGAAPLPAENGFRSAGPSPGASLGDGGAGRDADLNRPMGLRVRPNSTAGVDLYLADTDWFRVRVIEGVELR